jgi:hypothetical protein
VTQQKKTARELRDDARRRSASLKPGGSAQLPISPGRRRPGESVYRHPRLVDRQGTVVALIFALMAVLLGVFIGICVYRSAHGQDVGEAFVTWGVTSAILGPVTIAAVLGGLTLNRYGWVVGLGFGAGFQLLVVGNTLDEPRTTVTGIVLLVVPVLGFFLLGYVRRVPMWIGGRLGPRRVVDGGLADGEDRPGHVADH